MKIELYSPLSIHELGQRPNQEDSLWPQEDKQSKLFVVCDGMGGHEKGEVASQTVCAALGEWFTKNAKDPFSDTQLQEALEYAYLKLDAQDGGELKKMGTTLTLLYISSNGITAAHIGDSRIYHIRPSKGILYQSRDHSLVFDLLQAGEITYEEMATYPQKNVITRAMTPGEDNRCRPDIIHITNIKSGDYFYMCSDGMLEQMSDEELVNILSEKVPNEIKREKLIAATVNNHDNHTAWLLQVKDVFIENGDNKLIDEEPTARCNAVNIIKNRREQQEVEIAGSDDVVVVSAPPRRRFIGVGPVKVKRKKPFLKIILIILAFFVIVTAGGLTAYHYFFKQPETKTIIVKKKGKDKKTKSRQVSKSDTAQKPIMPKPGKTNDSAVQKANETNKSESVKEQLEKQLDKK